MEKIKLYILGSIGWIPNRGQHTCCYCLEYEDLLIIFDAGTGMSRFIEPWAQELLSKYKRIVILLSHYHLDHTSGLMYITRFFREKEVHIAGPGFSIYGKSAKEILSGLITPPYVNRSIKDFPMNLHIQDLEIGFSEIAGVKVETRLQDHSDPSLGIKIENSVCYITDLCYTDKIEAFVKKCKLLMHESWFDKKEYNELLKATQKKPADRDLLKALNSHSSVCQASQVAMNGEVEKLILIHHNPGYDEDRILQMERDSREIFADSHLAMDGQVRII